jgi:hypothetical protein
MANFSGEMSNFERGSKFIVEVVYLLFLFMVGFILFGTWGSITFAAAFSAFERFEKLTKVIDRLFGLDGKRRGEVQTEAQLSA